MSSSGCHGRKSPRTGATVDSLEKFMFTIVWNPCRFHVVKVLEKGQKFNAIYYKAEMISPLYEWRSIETYGNKRKLIVDADNARPHTAKVST
jgi:hypothetical protein